MASQETDVNVQQLLMKLKSGERVPGYGWNGKWVTKNNKLLVGGDHDLRVEIINLCHSSSMGGHSGVHGMNQRLKGMFYWKGITKMVRESIRKCDVCMRAKNENISSPGLLQPLPSPDTIFADISMDFIGGLPKSQGKDTIFVVVDRLTKYGHFMLLKHPFTARDVAQSFLDNVYKLHGNPTSIVSDRDPIFMSTFWKEFMALQGIAVNLSTAYHP